MLKKVLVLVSFLILVALVWRIPFMGTRVSDLPSGGTPKLSPVLTKTYSGILYKIERNGGERNGFTVLVNEEKSVRRFDLAPEMVGEAKTSELKVGDGILLTVQSRGVQQEVVNTLKQDNPLLGTVTGKVVSFSGKKMVLNWYENEITVNMGKMAKFSVKYDKATNTPGKQVEVIDFSRMKVGDAVMLGIDRVASSESLVINTVQVLN